MELKLSFLSYFFHEVTGQGLHKNGSYFFVLRKLLLGSPVLSAFLLNLV